MFPFDFISSLLAGCSSLPFSANGSAVEVDPGSRKRGINYVSPIIPIVFAVKSAVRLPLLAVVPVLMLALFGREI